MQRELLVPLLAGVLLLGGVRTTSADQDLNYPSPGSADYNPTTVYFTVTGQQGTQSVSGGGNEQATLNGTPVSAMYCLQYNVDVWVPGDYPNSLVNQSGQIHGGALPFNTLLASNANTAANEIAWLMLNEAPKAATLDEQAGLQALIWQILTPGFAVSTTPNLNSASMLAAYNQDESAMLGAHITASSGFLNQVYWVTPGDSSGNTNYQAQVATIATPEPATVAMALSGAPTLGLVALRRRRRMAA